MTTPTRNTNIVATFLVLLRDDQVLLQKRMNTGYHDGDYGIISGHVEANETFSQGIVREAQEEAGVTVWLEDLQPAHIMHRKSTVDGSERVDVYFIAKQWQGEPINQEPHKCEELKWFPINDLPDNTIPYIRNVLRDITAGIFYSEHGWKSDSPSL